MSFSSRAQLHPVKAFTAVGAASVTDGRCLTFWARLSGMKATNPTQALLWVNHAPPTAAGFKSIVQMNPALVHKNKMRHK